MYQVWIKTGIPFESYHANRGQTDYWTWLNRIQMSWNAQRDQMSETIISMRHISRNSKQLFDSNFMHM